MKGWHWWAIAGLAVVAAGYWLTAEADPVARANQDTPQTVTI